MIKKRLMGRITSFTVLCFVTSASVHAKATAKRGATSSFVDLGTRKDLGWG